MNRTILSKVCIFTLILTLCLQGCKDKKEQEEEPVAATGVTLNKTELTLMIGADETLTTTVMPDDATDKKITWHSDNELTATVDDGKITAVAAGTASIIATTANGIKATCVVTVPNNPGHEYGIKTRLIPKGAFTMGSPTNEYGRFDNETQHKVTLTKDFWMSSYTITNDQYATFLNAKEIGSPAEAEVESYGKQMLLYSSSGNYNWGLNWNAGRWEPASGYKEHPVVNVTWWGAVAYAKWVGGSLPTEAQWEYACRAGSETAYSFGTSGFGDYGWFLTGGTEAVGKKLPNKWGLYDMHGNVNEWCTDWYDDKYGNSNADATDPIGVVEGDYRVLRGGDWSNGAQYSRSAFRGYDTPDGTNASVGFRVIFVP